MIDTATTNEQKSSRQMRVLGERFISFINPPLSLYKNALSYVIILVMCALTPQFSYAEQAVEEIGIDAQYYVRGDFLS